jgi:hypothetical protein
MHTLLQVDVLACISDMICALRLPPPPCNPQVVGALLDCEAPDDFINNLILSVRSLLPVDTLVEQVGGLGSFVSCSVCILVC